MAKSALIIGGSGSGKSTSARTLPVENTFYINVSNKDLPFKQDPKYSKVGADNPPGGGKIYATDNASRIEAAIKAASEDPNCKYAVIDDWQYVSANEFMRRSTERGFDKFTEIGKNIWQHARIPAEIERDDFIIFFLTHAEEITDQTGARIMKAKTIGKLVDDKITLEGMFSIVLFAKVKLEGNNRENIFVTQNTGDSTAKSPMGMFEDLEISNDLELVANKINNFYE